MSLTKTFLMFLDVWGLGNRGMFRTLRDLVLRPGYLIADYLQGRHGAYFPPFKLLFLLTTLSLLVGHGFNLLNFNYQGEPLALDSIQGTESEGARMVTEWINAIFRFQHGYPAIFQLLFMGFMGYFFFIFFRKSEIMGKLSFHEFFVAVIYMVDMFIIFNTFCRITGLSFFLRSYAMLLIGLYLIPLKQLSGYGWFKTVIRATAGLITGLIAISVLLILMILIAVLVTSE